MKALSFATHVSRILRGMAKTAPAARSTGSPRHRQARRLAAALIAACGSAVAAAAQGSLASIDAAPGPPPAPWRFVSLPKKTPTRFAVVELDGARAMRIEADGSYGNVVHDLDEVPARLLTWQWRIDQRNDAADLTRKQGDDTALKICALFDMPLSRLSFGERQLLRVGRMATGEDLPAASVCYVWDSRAAPGTEMPSAFTKRVRYVVLRGPEAPLANWATEKRDLAADFKRLFGDESPDVPPLAGIAIGADADNTRARSVGYVRALKWAP